MNQKPEFIPGTNRKAYVLNGTDLYSYDTLVAHVRQSEAVVLDTHSATTLRHIKAFLTLNGFKAETKKQIERDYQK